MLLRLAAMVFFLLSASAGTKHAFQHGILVSLNADERIEDGSSERWAIFAVRIGDLVYTARGERIRRRSGDYGQGLIVGDPVDAAVEDGSLYLLKPDGKELKTKIIKRERAR